MFWQWILLALLCITMRYRSGLQITFLDVGQGDCIYLAGEKGDRYLIDGGSSSKSDVGTYQILPFLKEEGADMLDAVFVTHMDIDHYNGLQMLVEEMVQNGVVIENLILPAIGAESRGEAYAELEALALRQGISVHYIHRGKRCAAGTSSLPACIRKKGRSRKATRLPLCSIWNMAHFQLFLQETWKEAARRRSDSS